MSVEHTERYLIRDGDRPPISVCRDRDGTGWHINRRGRYFSLTPVELDELVEAADNLPIGPQLGEMFKSGDHSK